MLRIHALVTEEARAEFAALRWRCYAATAALGAAGPAAAALGFLYADLAPAAAGSVGVAGAVAGVLAVVRSSMLLVKKNKLRLPLESIQGGLGGIRCSAVALGDNEVQQKYIPNS